MAKRVCEECGALYIEGKGFVEPHQVLCFNQRYGYFGLVEVPETWQRQEGYRPPHPVYEFMGCEEAD